MVAIKTKLKHPNSVRKLIHKACKKLQFPITLALNNLRLLSRCVHPFAE